jgi:hypothetical protein
MKNYEPERVSDKKFSTCNSAHGRTSSWKNRVCLGCNKNLKIEMFVAPAWRKSCLKLVLC